MGASLVYLESPNKEKHSKEGKNDKYTYGACEMQGWRLNMEDAIIINPDFEEDTALFGVFDGHGGMEASKVVEKQYERILKENEKYKAGDIKGGLYDSFKETDVYLGSQKGKEEMMKVADANPTKDSPLMNILAETNEKKESGEK